jgi:hypothetical protein
MLTHIPTNTMISRKNEHILILINLLTALLAPGYPLKKSHRKFQQPQPRGNTKGSFGTTSPAASEAVLDDVVPKGSQNSFAGEAARKPLSRAIRRGRSRKKAAFHALYGRFPPLTSRTHTVVVEHRPPMARRGGEAWVGGLTTARWSQVTGRRRRDMQGVCSRRDLCVPPPRATAKPQHGSSVRLPPWPGGELRVSASMGDGEAPTWAAPRSRLHDRPGSSTTTRLHGRLQGPNATRVGGAMGARRVDANG